MIEYRKADITDISELVRLRVEFISEIQGIQPSAKISELISNLQDYYQETIPQNEYISWLALDNDQIIGTSGVCFYRVPPKFSNLTGKVAYIISMYTLPQYRKLGVASALFDKIIEESRNHGYSYIALHATEKGRPLYSKYGFTESDNEMIMHLD